jgi:hypothetical protein
LALCLFIGGAAYGSFSSVAKLAWAAAVPNSWCDSVVRCAAVESEAQCLAPFANTKPRHTSCAAGRL